MQMMRALLVVALLVAPVTSASVSASSAALAWLQSHKSPSDDQLKELAGANPAAFAIVNALLAKHAQGKPLLSAEERGPDVFRKMMTPAHLSAATPRVAVPYASAELAEVGRPVVDAVHFNANAAADRDDSAVSRLLSAVANMGGKKGKKMQALLAKRHQKEAASTNALAADADIFAGDVKPATQEQVQEQVAQAVQVVEATPAPPAAPEKQENSYLKGIDLSGDMPQVAGQKGPRNHFPQMDDNTDALTSFSFGDSAPTAKPVPKVVAAPKPKKENAFLKWLSIGKKAPEPVEQAAPAAPVEKKQNSYLDSVKFFG